MAFDYGVDVKRWLVSQRAQWPNTIATLNWYKAKDAKAPLVAAPKPSSEELTLDQRLPAARRRFPRSTP